MNFFKNLQTERKVFGIVLLISVIITGILFSFVFLAKQQPQQEPAVVGSDPTPLDTSDFTLSEVEGWQTYRNEELGFEVEYDQTYITIGEQKDRVYMIFPEPDTAPVANFIIIKVFPSSLDKSVEEILIENTFLGRSAEHHPKSITQFVTKKIEDKTFYYIWDYVPEDTILEYYYYMVGSFRVASFVFVTHQIDVAKYRMLSRNEMEILIEEEGAHQILKEILSTFRFLE